jgi:hypothetical protein
VPSSSYLLSGAQRNDLSTLSLRRRRIPGFRAQKSASGAPARIERNDAISMRAGQAYGGADTVVCLAHGHLSEVLDFVRS